MFLSHNITFLLLFLHLLRLFDPLPGIGLPVFFLQSVRLAADGQLFVLSNLAAFFCTSSSHLFLGFPAGFLPRLPSRIRFGILFSSILNTCPPHINVSTRMYVTRSVYLYSQQFFIVPYSLDATNL